MLENDDDVESIKTISLNVQLDLHSLTWSAKFLWTKVGEEIIFNYCNNCLTECYLLIKRKDVLNLHSRD